MKLREQYAQTPPTDTNTSPATPPLLERITARLFNIHAKPAEPTPRFYIGRIPICTPGNLTAISAPPKSAKSSFVGAMLSAAMTPRPDVADCLGVSARNPDGKALLHFDTEQSIADHFNLVERAVARARLTEPPPWLRSYCATGFSITEARLAVSIVTEAAATLYGGIFAILLDGVADLVKDVNDPEECNVFVNDLHSLAIKYDCSVLGVIHLNPNSEKTRGHLGSQLERKSETNLRIERDGDAFVVWSEKNRRAPILKPNGPRFVWSEDMHMFVSTQTASEAKAKSEVGILQAQAEAVFCRADKTALRYGDFQELLAKETKLSEGGARKRMEKMIGAQILRKDVIGFYVLA